MCKCFNFAITFFVLWSRQIYCQNNFFVSHKYAIYSSEYLCVTNTSLALAWITDGIRKDAQPISTVVPLYQLDTDITINDDFYGSPWVLKNSLEDDFNDLILDYRWEEMKEVITTSVNRTRQELQYETVISNLENDFDIPLSIRTDKDAHIFLCDSDSPDGNCYWLMLQAFNGARSAIRKCRKNSIPFKHGEYPGEPCKTPVIRIDHPPQDPYLSWYKWSHFKLTKKSAKLSFSQFKENNLNKILEWTDEDETETFDVTHMIIHSKSGDGIWKIHSTQYIYTNQESSDTPLGSRFLVSGEPVCISMFVSLCDSCQLILKLESSAGIKYGARQYVHQKTGWMELKYIESSIQTSYLRLLVSTIGNSKNAFWAIDSIRQCRSQEYRFIKIREKATCQLMSSSDNDIIFPNNLIVPSKSQCPENTIGEFCMPCSLLYNVCTELTICTEKKCFCSAGYTTKYSTFRECSYECPDGFYGHGCRKTCENCYDNCNKVDGTCSSCFEGYTGSKCEIPPLQIKNLMVYSKNENSISLRWSPPPLATQYILYIIYYKTGYQNNSVSDIFKKMKCNIWSDYHCATLFSLDSDTLYTVIIRARSSDFKTISLPATVTEFTKRERSEAPYDLNVTWSSSNRLLVSWKHPNQSNGGIQHFNIMLRHGSTTISRSLPVTEKTYNLTYYYTIDTSTLLPQAYQVIVSAFNGEDGYEVRTTVEVPSVTPDLSLLGLLVLLLLIPVIVILYTKRDKLSVAKYNPFAKAKKRTLDEQTPLSALTNNDKTIEALPSQLNTYKKQKVYSKLVDVAKLEEYVKEAVTNCELDRQHALFPSGQIKPGSYGALPENAPKNRNANVTAYDHTRVILENTNGKEHSNYINANYIDGYKQPRAYIATQGPKLSTTFDFWKMVCQENVEYIIALTKVHENNEKKFEKYWPESNEKFLFGDILVERESHQIFADYEYRVFNVTNNQRARSVHHYQFLSWPEHGLPFHSQSLVNFLQIMQPIRASPIVVHCSEGFGKTGTVILCDICLKMAAEEAAIDVLRVLQKIREQRPNMVEYVYQYKLAHLVILEYLFGIKTSIPCEQIHDVVDKMNKEEISSQLIHLQRTIWFQSIVPEIQSGSLLFDSAVADAAPINAAIVDGFGNPGRFITTQQPSSTTLEIFWKLVSKKNVSVVISLNETSNPFWPTASDRRLVVEGITIIHTKTEPSDFCNLTSIKMVPKSSKKPKIIKIVELRNWPSEANCPKSIKNFLMFWEQSYTMFKESTPVIVTCFDGIFASGLYLALTFTIEKMQLERICDVYQAVKTIRLHRRQFIPNEEQFGFLYKAAAVYAQMFQGYANFEPPAQKDNLYCEIP